MRPQVRVGLVSWNTRALLERCLAALPAALDDLEATVVVVDNDSADGSADAADRFGFVTVIRNEVNVGYARAMNQALGSSDAEVLIALNPDTAPPPGSLTNLVARLLERPEAGLVSPRLVNDDGTTQHSGYTFPSCQQAAVVCFLPARWQRGRLGRRLWLEGASPHDTPTDVEWVIGAVHVLRADAVDSERPYPERWFMYVEEPDLCWQMANRGWVRRLEADISVPHVGGASAKQAWGADPSRRYMPASYDWFAYRRGWAATRLWATMNTIGVSRQALRSTMKGRHGDPDAAAWAVALRRMIPLHLHAMWRQPGYDSSPPPRSADPPIG